jgi:hypothetical protein
VLPCDPVRDTRLVKTARRLAADIITADPALTKPENARLLPLIMSSERLTTLS